MPEKAIQPTPNPPSPHPHQGGNRKQGLMSSDRFFFLYLKTKSTSPQRTPNKQKIRLNKIYSEYTQQTSVCAIKYCVCYCGTNLKQTIYKCSGGGAGGRRPKFKLCGVWRDKMGWEKGEINFVFLNSVHINIFIKTKKEKGAWDGKETGEQGSVGPSQFYLTKKYELISWWEKR